MLVEVMNLPAGEADEPRGSEVWGQSRAAGGSIWATPAEAHPTVPASSEPSWVHPLTGHGCTSPSGILHQAEDSWVCS